MNTVQHEATRGLQQTVSLLWSQPDGRQHLLHLREKHWAETVEENKKLKQNEKSWLWLWHKDTGCSRQTLIVGLNNGSTTWGKNTTKLWCGWAVKVLQGDMLGFYCRLRSYSIAPDIYSTQLETIATDMARPSNIYYVYKRLGRDIWMRWCCRGLVGKIEV